MYQSESVCYNLLLTLLLDLAVDYIIGLSENEGWTTDCGHSTITQEVFKASLCPITMSLKETADCLNPYSQWCIWQNVTLSVYRLSRGIFPICN